MATLEDAILLAVQAHQGQVDKVGQPYILHPLRVMLRLPTEDARIVAVLHDVVEDTEYSLADLRALGYAEPIVQALDCLTRREAETYKQFMERVETNPLARQVKLADLEDNMDVRRLSQLAEPDVQRLNRYLEAWSSLQAIANLGSAAN